ncbi:MAG: bis(5'-nucleosyl)-tetraphosphatase (symmetrical) YqeK [Actinobacteria bacterium]|nr:bis(5'-nucleosyl)-tetraphosphatase (symmetrical) YqeK [Actinomycetota bacterium]
MHYDNKKIKEELEKWLKKEDFEHSVRVAEFASEVAKKFDLNSKKAYLTALLHDYGRGFSNNELLIEAIKWGIRIDPVEEKNPFLLHAVVGAREVAFQFQIDDKEILSAIEKHTVGSLDMSAFDKLIYIADMIEPERDYSESNEIYDIFHQDIDKAFERAYANSLIYLIKHKKLIHPISFEIWNSLH